MGRVRTREIKNLALRILEENRDKFTDKFEENKKILNQLYSFYSAKLRNRICGYITKLIRKTKTS